jgi:hypothetical protein
MRWVSSVLRAFSPAPWSSRVEGLPGLALTGELLLELGFEVGATAVESGAGDACPAADDGDVAFAVGGSPPRTGALAAPQQPVTVDKVRRAHRLAHHPPRHPAPQWMFCAHGITYAYCLSRHSYSAF